MNEITAYGIRRILKRKKLVQSHIAELAGFTPQQFNDMLMGRKLIRADHLPQIAQALGVEPGEIFREETETARPDGADRIRLDIDLGDCGYHHECRSNDDVLKRIKEAMGYQVQTVAVKIEQISAANQTAERH